MSGATRNILLVEPFYGGSHKQLIDLLLELLPPAPLVHLETLPAKKWHWRARTSALYFSQVVPRDQDFAVLFCSSVLNLAELIGLRPDLRSSKKVIYFHENQLVYPVRKQQERDFQYGYNQIISALVADSLVFNSNFNMDSFLSSIEPHLKLQPDFKPKNVRADIEAKCSVIYFPISLPPMIPVKKETDEMDDSVLHIVWPHRWEHDKNPEAFFACLLELKSAGFRFKVSVLGQAFSDVPIVFEEARRQLEAEVQHWGFMPDKDEYWRLLRSAHVAVSTAKHEFFGVSMMEAISCDCYPLVPGRLVYPELFPDECIYHTDRQLFKRLRVFCKYPNLTKKLPETLQVGRFSMESLKEQYLQIFQ